MTAYICETCGVQYPPSQAAPARCVICEDFRQYVRREGQSWTHLEALRAERRFDVRELEPGLHGIGIDPPFGIGQRALLVRTPAGNLLWDCAPLLEASAVYALGGVAAIAISHPHFYSTVADWSAQFGVPVWLPRADAEFRMRADFEIVDWEGSAEPLPGLRLVQAGGHFPGNAVLQWAAGAGGRGVLFTGDTVSVAGDPRWVSFMRSYPNLIPLGPGAMRRLTGALAPWSTTACTPAGGTRWSSRTPRGWWRVRRSGTWRRSPSADRVPLPRPAGGTSPPTGEESLRRGEGPPCGSPSREGGGFLCNRSDPNPTRSDPHFVK